MSDFVTRGLMASTKKKRKWMGSTPEQCDLCHVKLTDKFIDGRTVFGGWAIMCPACHRDQRIGLGIGKGQLYNLETLEKIDG